ncbi:MAG: thioredoxin [Acidimicrobiia bacterium]|nr:thioredoxin [Acidimicrobiia bacterium]
MATITLTKDTFEETIKTNDTVLVDFWASWCGPCRMFAPVYESVSEDNDDIVFAKVDTEAEPELAAAFNIMSIPTLMVVRDEVVIFQQAGALPRPALEELVEKVREVDMDDVRSKLAG